MIGKDAREQHPPLEGVEEQRHDPPGAPTVPTTGTSRSLFCCQFLALLIGALIEREIRTAMANAATRDIPLYPELRACPAPSAERILKIFTDLTRHEVHNNEQHVRPSEPVKAHAARDHVPLSAEFLDTLRVSWGLIMPQ